MKTRAKTIEKTISAPLLDYYYQMDAEKYGADYPEVEDPSSMLDGVEDVCRRIGDGQLADNVLLYIIDSPEQAMDLQKVKYVIRIRNESANPLNNENGYSICLFYTHTQQLESISTIDEHHIVWSPDTMKDTQHPARTKYYLGFAYLLCDNSPGFDTSPLPEYELTGAELLELGIEGEIPPDIIEIEIPEEQNVEEETEETYQAEATTEHQMEEPPLPEIPEKDDLSLPSPQEEPEEEIIDDLQVDYNELFE